MIVHSGTEVSTNFLIVNEDGNIVKVEPAKFQVSSLSQEDFDAALTALQNVRDSLKKEHCGESANLDEKLGGIVHDVASIKTSIDGEQGNGKLATEHFDDTLQEIVDDVVFIKNKLNAFDGVVEELQAMKLKMESPKKVSTKKTSRKASAAK